MTTFTQIDLSQVSSLVDKIRVWPWRAIAWITVVSFLLASIVSAAIGYMVMSGAEFKKVAVESGESNISWSRDASLTKQQIEKILERNIFNSEGQIGDLSNPQAEGGKMTKTQLPLKLLGIIYGGDPSNGIAMIENTEKKNTNSFLVGDLIAPEATVKEIHADQILIENQGRIEFLPLDEIEIRRSTRNVKKSTRAKTPTSLSGSSYATEPPPDSFKEEGFERKGLAVEMSSDYKSRMLGPEFANVLQDAKASPNVVDGVLKGWKLDRIRKNSIYEKFGIQNGDVVEEINGVALSDAGQAVKTLTGLKNESDFDIRVVRNGKSMQINAKVK